MTKRYNKILHRLKIRDEELIKRFCEKGAYMKDDTGEVRGVCKFVEMGELLTFLHQQDAHLIQILKECHDCNGTGEWIHDDYDTVTGEHKQRVDKCETCGGTGMYNKDE